MATKKVKRYNGEEDASLVTAEPEVTPEPVAPAKPKIVTKEELAKSGLSLRDYLNKQQGLTRRGVSKEREDVIDRESTGDAMAMRNKPRRSAEQLDTYANQTKSAVDRIPRDKSTVPAGESASGSELGRNIKNTLNATVGTRIPAGLAGMAGEKMAGNRAAAAAEKLMADRAARVAARRTAAEGRGPRPESMSPFAKGGSVSAARRGDGIASKGKTRGRMC
jgi:hypothetical protein